MNNISKESVIGAIAHLDPRVCHKLSRPSDDVHDVGLDAEPPVPGHVPPQEAGHGRDREAEEGRHEERGLLRLLQATARERQSCWDTTGYLNP